MVRMFAVGSSGYGIAGAPPPWRPNHKIEKRVRLEARRRALRLSVSALLKAHRGHELAVRPYPWLHGVAERRRARLADGLRERSRPITTSLRASPIPLSSSRPPMPMTASCLATASNAPSPSRPPRSVASHVCCVSRPALVTAPVWCLVAIPDPRSIGDGRSRAGNPTASDRPRCPQVRPVCRVRSPCRLP